MFTGELAETRQRHVTIHEISPLALELLVDFAYTSRIEVTESNVQVLLPAANLLQLAAVRDACSAFLQSQLDPTNCLGIKAFADLHACPDLKMAAHMFAQRHFVDVVKSEEFMCLMAHEVAELISSDDLGVRTEEHVFEAVLAWVKHDEQMREKDLPILMERVRLPLLSKEYLVTNVESEPIMKGNSMCKDYIIEAMKYHLMGTEQRAQLQTPRTQLRKSIGLPKAILVIGGQAPKAIRSVEKFDFAVQKWTTVAELNSRRCRCGVAVHNGLVYAVGGFDGSSRVRSVECYEVARDRWSVVESMNMRRSTLGAAVLNGCVYAVGGFDGSSGLDSVEKYDPDLNIWTPVAPMSIRRSSVGVAVLNNLLFALGGYDGIARQCLNTVECYNPESNTWQLSVPMNQCRSGSAVAVLDNCIYALGGHDGPDIRRTVEVYDAGTNMWTAVSGMKLCRRNAGAVAVNGLIYVVGGDDGTTNLNSMEVYDPRLDMWTMVQSCLSTGRSYAGISVVDKSSSLQ
jgi:kelch-like protein 2/3